MNKCNVPKKKILVSGNNKFSQDTVSFIKKQTSGISSDNE